MAKQYEVIGKTNVHGFDPGQKFHADLEEKHEARMIKGSFLRVVSLETVREPVKVSETGADRNESEFSDDEEEE